MFSNIVSVLGQSIWALLWYWRVQHDDPASSFAEAARQSIRPWVFARDFRWLFWRFFVNVFRSKRLTGRELALATLLLVLTAIAWSRMLIKVMNIKHSPASKLCCRFLLLDCPVQPWSKSSPWTNTCGCLIIGGTKSSSYILRLHSSSIHSL